MRLCGPHHFRAGGFWLAGHDTAASVITGAHFEQAKTNAQIASWQMTVKDLGSSQSYHRLNFDQYG
jgi:hypothetical protein